ncbi:hypothetical protein AMTR_s00053p00203760 [Amborella trichopoda]|uniref:Uncharacterized protein n=1 Tax=Amborella trichopoda TaxID=13333 RepID=W1PBV9_AMBTC|nr:hypothetical protein AMTR_s00053p00203760 [Amborella trichopoda]
MKTCPAPLYFTSTQLQPRSAISSAISAPLSCGPVPLLSACSCILCSPPLSNSTFEPTTSPAFSAITDCSPTFPRHLLQPPLSNPQLQLTITFLEIIRESLPPTCNHSPTPSLCSSVVSSYFRHLMQSSSPPACKLRPIAVAPSLLPANLHLSQPQPSVIIAPISDQ